MQLKPAGKQVLVEARVRYGDNRRSVREQPPTVYTCSSNLQHREGIGGGKIRERLCDFSCRCAGWIRGRAVKTGTGRQPGEYHKVGDS